ncbi:hypothetical protein [Chelatococcus reniformis]|uniref:Cell wall anchor protein n=1 Tax=Chelatococcus reniformis TaxID=1494448 RepID=A0A916UD82_9HYPH|nr:hypothetical protein [Chelatococcus reniformis]GGC68731.1 hypothetical protein GCM10010994_29140 [Chelatococcus reniformis]
MKLLVLAATAACALALAACNPAKLDASVSSTASKAAAACPYVLAGMAIAATTGNAKIQQVAAQVAPAVIASCTALQAGKVVDVQSAGAAILNAYASLLAAGAIKA